MTRTHEQPASASRPRKGLATTAAEGLHGYESTRRRGARSGPTPDCWIRIVAVWIALVLGTLTATAASAKSDPAQAASRHWAFQPPRRPAVPEVRASIGARTPVDQFVAAHLEREGLGFSPEADRTTLIRRVAFLVTGLPPRPDEIARFLADREPGAYERMTERYLASLHHGEAWGKAWLDAAGYADSNGYFSADSDRPLAYRYRDYVIRSINQDKPFDRFVREQLAGDQMAGWKPGQPVTAEIRELLEATHFLRNGQDGSGESDGNPDEVRVDRYYALDSALQIVGSSLFGLTVQCAKCHDHKFEPLTQRDYYNLQAILYPAFNIDHWIKPNDRIAEAAFPGEVALWQERDRRLAREEADLRAAFSAWVRARRPRGEPLFEDAFNPGTPLAGRWSNTAPGDDTPGGKPPVGLDSASAPGAAAVDGVLRIVEGGGTGDRWISTQRSFSWKPAAKGDWIQVTFDLVATRLDDQGKPAERVAYFLALHDFDDSGTNSGGNILIDGQPDGGASVHVDYPGNDATSRGRIGSTGYTAGRNYGVRIRNTGDGQYTLEHLVDGVVDGRSLKLTAADLPDGGFGFEYCCGRSFIVDNVSIESSRSQDPAWAKLESEFVAALKERQSALDESLKTVIARRTPKPGRVAWVTDTRAQPPVVPLLKRGNPKTPGDPVEPDAPAFLQVSDRARFTPEPGPDSTGRRLGLARWLTDPGSPQAALLARVTVNRIWQRYFGTGLVSTPENLGLSGAPPADPDLIDWLASALIDSGWRLKSVHRLLLASTVFRQSSAPRTDGLAKDPSNHRLWRYPVRRLAAEEIRDAILVASGQLGEKREGPYVPTSRTGSGEIVVDETRDDARSRSIFLQQRRTQVATFLSVFDAPSIVFNCTRRADTTMPLQSLSLLNSEFAVKRAGDMALRLVRDAGSNESAKIDRAFLLTCGRTADETEHAMAARFLQEQRALHGGTGAADAKAWSDFCQMLLASNLFLYLE